MKKITLSSKEIKELLKEESDKNHFQNLLWRMQKNLNPNTGEVVLSDKDINEILWFASGWAPHVFQKEQTNYFFITLMSCWIWLNDTKYQENTIAYKMLSRMFLFYEFRTSSSIQYCYFTKQYSNLSFTESHLQLLCSIRISYYPILFLKYPADKLLEPLQQSPLHDL